MKKLLVIGLLAVGGLWVCRNTNLPSYISTLMCRGQRALKNQVPRDLEIERLRNDIAKLDTRVRDLIGPIADKLVRIQELEAEVKTARGNQARLKQDVLALSAKVDKGGEFVSWDNETYTVADARSRLEADLARYEDLGATVKHREHALTALRESVRLGKKRLTTLKEQKRNFEARLARIEAAQEYLTQEEAKVGRNGNQDPASNIDQGLKDLERRLKVLQSELELERQFTTQQSGPPRPGTPALTTEQIRARLGVAAPTVTSKDADNN